MQTKLGLLENEFLGSGICRSSQRAISNLPAVVTHFPPILRDSDEKSMLEDARRGCNHTIDTVLRVAGISMTLRIIR